MWFVLLFFYFAHAECGLQPNPAKDALAKLSCDIAQDEIRSYLKNVDPCLLDELNESNVKYSFLDVPATIRMGVAVSEVSVTKLREFADDVVRPSRFSKHYPAGAKSMPELKKFMLGLAEHLEKKGLTRITYQGLVREANLRIAEAKKNGEVGECYSLQSFGGVQYVFGSVSRPENVSPANQKKIDDLMKGSQSEGYHFGDVDADLYKSKRLTIEELKELKALRKASAVFEQSTFMKNDDAGGFFSNFKGEIAGGDQVNCVLESENHEVFLSKLEEKGLLKNFTMSGQVTRASEPSKKDITGSGHVAVVLTNKRTGEKFVYDSWFEKGGDPAHIMTMDDWKNLSLDFKNKFRDVVPEK